MSNFSPNWKIGILMLAITATSCSKDGISPNPSAQSHSDDDTARYDLPPFLFTPDPSYLQPPYYPTIRANRVFGFYWGLTQSIGYQQEWPMTTKVTIRLYKPAVDDLYGNHEDGYDKTFENIDFYPGPTPRQNGYESVGVVLRTTNVQAGSYMVTISSEPDINGGITSLYKHDSILLPPTTTFSSQLNLN